MTELAPQSRFPWWAYWTALVFIAIFTLWPIGLLATTFGIADANGCGPQQGSLYACLAMGDWGETLYTMGVLGWLMLVSVPLGLGAFIVWLIILPIHHAAWARAIRAGH
ncbi:MAG: hypothetical protein JWP26_1844 [Devosia sp.]|uniref:hypothetical protein n=1 Tax=Devosia sp. TaxID=1871048 RepID=UPI00262755CA|nr:hypothetical protein [Devosia sp.]MDB5586874.1 hypothetical protein [Devosia sp.]